jgi:hypothetical protein
MSAPAGELFSGFLRAGTACITGVTFEGESVAGACLIPLLVPAIARSQKRQTPRKPRSECAYIRTTRWEFRRR